MEAAKQSSRYRIEDPAQAAVFDDPLRARLLLACGRTERSLSELRRETGQPLSKLHYHAGRLIASGLLVVSRTEPRAGRAVRFYRAVAEAFLVSQAAIKSPTSALWSRELRESLADAANRRELWVLYATDEQRRFRVVLTDRDGRPPRPGGPVRAREYWKILRLNPDQRLALARDIEELLRRYEAPEPAGQGEPYLLHAAFAPRRRGPAG